MNIKGIMTKSPTTNDETIANASKRSASVTLPPIDATPEEITKALFRLKPESETEQSAKLARV